MTKFSFYEIINLSFKEGVDCINPSVLVTLSYVILKFGAEKVLKLTLQDNEGPSCRGDVKSSLPLNLVKVSRAADDNYH